jgi:hypothetical protein
MSMSEPLLQVLHIVCSLYTQTGQVEKRCRGEFGTTRMLEVTFEHSEAATTTELRRRRRTSLAESLDEMILVIHVHLESLVVDITPPDLGTVEYQKLCSP